MLFSNILVPFVNHKHEYFKKASYISLMIKALRFRNAYLIFFKNPFSRIVAIYKKEEDEQYSIVCVCVCLCVCVCVWWWFSC